MKFDPKTNPKTKTRIYWIWRNMLQRCKGTNGARRKDYADRGIYMCKEWEIFENFYKDMDDCPQNMSLDRINNDGPYDKANCRWADRITQRRNGRFLRPLTYKGKTQLLRDWSRELGIKESTICMRFNYGWTIKEALGGKHG